MFDLKYGKLLYLLILCYLSLVPFNSSFCADIIFINGNIITVDKNFSIVEAIAIFGNKIEKVGSNSELLKLSNSKTKIIDLKGKTVLPGLVDSHTHPIYAGESELFEEIPNVQTLQELLFYIKEEVKKKNDGEWIIHPKFFATRLNEMRAPNLKELDEVSPNNPVFLNGSYGGSINSYAMKISGINKSTDHKGIQKDDVIGEPTGVLNKSAFKLVKLGGARSNKLIFNERLDALENILKKYNMVGFTSITDGQLSPINVKIYQTLLSQGRLSVRVFVNIRAPRFESKEQFAKELKKLGYFTGFGDSMLRIGALKIGLDGGILTGTAYMREPWGERAKEVYGIGGTNYRGILNYDEEQLEQIVTIASDIGWKMTAHITGGGGVDMMLDAYDKVNRKNKITDKRFSIIHGNFFTPKAIVKCKELGVIADCQYGWFYKDSDAMKYILGDERIKTFMPLNSMVKAGVIVSGGSDHMVKFDSYSAINPYNPFLGMYSLITRKNEKGNVINSSEAISREDAIKIYTINNAYGSLEEDIKGSLEKGKLADLIVISDDLLTCSEESIKDIKVVMTMLDGKIVFDKL